MKASTLILEFATTAALAGVMPVAPAVCGGFLLTHVISQAHRRQNSGGGHYTGGHRRPLVSPSKPAKTSALGCNQGNKEP